MSGPINITIYENLADLLEYPKDGMRSQLKSCEEILAKEESVVSRAFADFSGNVSTLSLSDLQELYTRTFDLSPVCALDIGYHLFGENYKRGIFLANLRETEALFDLGQEHQLPDYLPVLLRLLTRLDDAELRSALIVDCMIPALEKMLKTLSEGANPYRHLIEVVRKTLQSEARVEPLRTVPLRASLPILAFDPRNDMNRHETTNRTDTRLAQVGLVSCDLVDRRSSDLKTPTGF